MSCTSDAACSPVRAFATRWQHHSKLGCQAFARTYIHTHANKHTHFPSDNKGARRCFHDSELDFTASVLHEKEADIEMVGWCSSFVADCMVFQSECACAQFCVNVRESTGRGWERERGWERARGGQSGPLYISRRAVWDTTPSVFGLSPTCAVLIPFSSLGGRRTPISSPILDLPIWSGSHSFPNQRRIALSLGESVLSRGQMRAN